MNLKLPTIPFGLSRALFSDNLSRNSCIWIKNPYSFQVGDELLSALTRIFSLLQETLTVIIIMTRQRTSPAKIPAPIFHPMHSFARSSGFEPVSLTGHRPKDASSVSSSSGDFPEI